jgi:hypothetical protein
VVSLERGPDYLEVKDLRKTRELWCHWEAAHPFDSVQCGRFEGETQRLFMVKRNLFIKNASTKGLSPGLLQDKVTQGSKRVASG